MARSLLAALCLVSVLETHAMRGLEASSAGANPIRKVVTMLQAMQKKVTEEGEKETELFEKFMCYCRNSGSQLTTSVAGAEGKISNLGSEIKAAEEKKVQIDEDLKQAQVDRSSGKDAMKEATAIREKEASAFAEEKSTLDADISAIEKAVAALERGMAGGFLQTGTAALLRQLMAQPHDSLQEEDRQEVLAFLEGSSEYAPKSGQVVGILKELGDEMKKSLADATSKEEDAIKTYEELIAAKKKEVGALTEAVETKMTRSGELAVEIVQMQNGLSDTEESLIADKEFLANLEKDCDKKKTEWEEIKKTRAEELMAIAETIKILNDDDALDLFKKTLPGAASSFVQLRANALAVRERALTLLRKAVSAGSRAGGRPGRAQFDLLVLALRGQKVGFEKVIKMIDNMVANLKQEQLDDDHKKEYCGKQLDSADDQRKSLERSVSDKETAIQTAEEAVAQLKEEIDALEVGIKELDKTVAEASEQRKAEHEEFTSLMASNSAAKELLGFAKNRLNKFYNPKLHKPEEEAPAFAQISAHRSFGSSSSSKDAPPPPPATFDAYTKKGEESSGVIALLNRLIQDLDKEMTEAETAERDAQADYEGSVKDAAEKRAADSKLLTEKGAQKASLLESAASNKDQKESLTKELAATLKYLQSLHTECDWLLKYFDVRQEARSSEIDSLNKAKAILSGADFSLLQTRAAGRSVA